ncbi:hypothetical protein ACIQOU_30315 [Streptomyces sp. NPDC091279]|uniref:hypothetical protein n=1 Tax=Streptomyces sp. NPDC091279 TaxID=3365983 RepID=UPI00380DF2AF
MAKPDLLPAGAGALVRPASEARFAAETWLLGALRDDTVGRAHREWRRLGAIVLPLGELFSAVRLPQTLVNAIAHTAGPIGDLEAVDEVLREALDEAPVICDTRYGRWYVLVPPSMPTTWSVAAEEWAASDIEVLGHGTCLGVPPTTATTYDDRTGAGYWSVPMGRPGELCSPLMLARMIAAGVRRIAGGKS